MKNRAYTTLFMIESVDGKISTGDVDELDVDKDFKRIVGIKEGLPQYYEIESHTDRFSLNSGRVMAKIGVNTRTTEPKKMGVNFIILDNKPHLTEKGVGYLAQWVNILYLVTTNKNHPAYKVKEQYPNIEIIEYKNIIDMEDLLTQMKQKYGAKRITIQSGGTMNALWIRQNLIDQINIVIAPCLIGGSNTQSLVGGESLHSQEDLLKIKPLKLKKVNKLKNSYIQVVYDVIHNTKIEG